MSGGSQRFPANEQRGNVVPSNQGTNAGVKKLHPSQAYDVINVARAANQDDFAPRVQELFSPEVEACMEAIKSTIYVSYRPIDPPYDHQDCIRINSKGRCFCSHLLNQHETYKGGSQFLKCTQSDCKCTSFAWVPSRPEDSGEFWLPRRKNYVAADYRAKCRCKHTHEEHQVVPSPHKCVVKGCGCSLFHSAFVCAACDMHWHKHRTVFEFESERVRDGRPVRQDWLPFAELPDMCQIALTGVDNPSVQVLSDALPAHLRERMALEKQAKNAPPSGNDTKVKYVQGADQRRFP